MTNYEFLKSEKATIQDMLQLATAGCRCCIYRGKFKVCSKVKNVHCDSGYLLWLQAEHEEEEEKND